MKPTDDQISEQVGLAIDHPGLYPGMSYVEGVQAALDWVTGHTDALPIDPADVDEG